MTICFKFFSQPIYTRDSISANEYCKKGLNSFGNKNYVDAISFFNRAATADPKNYLCFFYKSQVNAILKKYDLAINDINKAISLDPMNSRAFHYKGLLQNTLKNYQDAMECFSMLIQLKPSFLDGYYLRAYSNRMLNKNNEALSDLNYVISRRKDTLDFRDRGQINFDLRKFDDAISDFNSYFKYGGKEVIPTYYYRGISYYQVAKFDSAIADLSAYLKSYSPNVNVLNRLGLSYAKMGKEYDAQLQFANSIELDPKNAETYYYYYLSEYILGHCSKAQEIMQKYTSIAADSAFDGNYYNSRGLINACLGDTIMAFADYSTSIRRDPKNVQPYFNKIILLFNDSSKSKMIAAEIDSLNNLLGDSSFSPYLYSIKAYLGLRSLDSSSVLGNLINASKRGKPTAFAFYNLAAYYLVFLTRDTTAQNLALKYLKLAITLDATYLDSYKLLSAFYFYFKNDIKLACATVLLGLRQGNDEQLIILKRYYCNNGKVDKEKFPVEIPLFNLPGRDNELFSSFLNEIIRMKSKVQRNFNY